MHLNMSSHGTQNIRATNCLNGGLLFSELLRSRPKHILHNWHKENKTTDLQIVCTTNGFLFSSVFQAAGLRTFLHIKSYQ